jgi:hypothetical protein
VFLTAAHCTLFFQLDLATEFAAYVTFENPIPFGALTAHNTALVSVTQVVTNPAYNKAKAMPGTLVCWF